MDERIAAWLSDEDLDILWRRVLRRPITERERADAEERLASGVSRSALLESVVASAEFRHIRRIDDAVARGLLGGRPRTIEQPADAPEAAVEIAWCLGRVSAEERVLDVGYAFAERAYLAALAVLDADVTAVDLVVVDIPGVASVQADLRALPFDDDEFDVAIGISTLQVVGRDNSRYGLAPEDNDTIE
ncbi:MAG TPA: class I SAM-dependent methyltransferase, partial [Gaiellaceae bacterium]